ncbi:helix-turn-helix domain-containing protein [Sphingobacterium sp. MYb388]|uniref:helix-turn-helix domain-containing protein n=1 Tax=Sphingobacterium sp. MYb388 TaxID=2745437 RepID=UPI00309B1973
MGMIKDKSLILNEIKLHYGFKNDAEFARFLGIKPNSLANWYSRNTFNYETLFTKCDDIRAEWFFTGEGSMLKAEKTSTSIDKKLTTEETSEKSDAEYWKNEYIAVQKKYTALLENKLQEVLTGDKSSKAG